MKNLILALILILSGSFCFAHTGTTLGQKGADNIAVTGAVTLTSMACGVTITESAAVDGTVTTLPLAATVPGCELLVSYIGANGGALVTLTPNNADGIIGSCTLANSVVSFSGTGGAAVKLTKATGLKGDFIRLQACTSTNWCVVGCEGIWAN